MDEIKIRKAKKEDLPRISEILLEESKKKPYFQDWSIKTSSERIKNYFKNEKIWVSTNGKKILGFIICNPNEENKRTRISEFWIDFKEQRKGVGRKMLEHVENYYKKKKFRKIFLLTHKKANASNFYKKLDYKSRAEYIDFEKELK